MVYRNFFLKGCISNFRCIYFPHPCNLLSAQQRGEEKVRKFEMHPFKVWRDRFFPYFCTPKNETVGFANRYKPVVC